MSLDEADLDPPGSDDIVSQLSEKEVKILDDWIRKFEQVKGYPVVGTLWNWNHEYSKHTKKKESSDIALFGSSFLGYPRFPRDKKYGNGIRKVPAVILH